MSKLVEELIEEHQELTDMLNQVKEMGLISKEATELLFKSKKILLDHLKKEDDLLYPPLREYSEELIKDLVIAFTTEMETISVSAIQFFEKYTNNSKPTNGDFEKDMTVLFSSLKDRLDKEEEILFPKYDEIIGDKE